MLHLEDLRSWLIDEGVTTYMAIGPASQPKKEPHNCYTFWETGRVALQTEDALDEFSFQNLTRGATGPVARNLAEEFDDLMLSARNFDLNGTFVLQIRNISGPVNLGPDNFGGEDSQQNRTEFSANYRVLLGR